MRDFIKVTSGTEVYIINKHHIILIEKIESGSAVLHFTPVQGGGFHVLTTNETFEKVVSLLGE